MTWRMYDAAYPPPSPPAVDAVAFYIGGDTPHTWSASEIARQPARYRLPIYVRSNPSGAVAKAMSRLRVHPVTTRVAVPVTKALARLRSRTYTVAAAGDVVNAVAWLRANKAPKGSVVALDLETAINGPYVKTFDAGLTAAGFKVMSYGSLSTIWHNPRTSGGTWVAHYTGSAHMEPGADATQWASDVMLGHPWDLSEVSTSVPLWDTHAPSPQPPPQPQEEEDMAQRDLKDGLDKTSGLLLPPKTGGYGYVEAGGDNTFTNGQVKAFAPVTIRVAVEKSDGTWQTQNLVVGRTPKDAKQPRFRIKLVDKNSVYVSVTRVDGDGTEEITIAAY